MKRFSGIEGLRAYLAWAVVFSHIVLFTAAVERMPSLRIINQVAEHAVPIFIIISGFVITHLLIEKKEPYLPYIIRRFLRIYPVYILCLLAGIVSTELYLDTFLAHPWGELVPQGSLIQAEHDSLTNGGFGKHMLAHLTLMHGVISDHILDKSEYMFLPPAWSLSLEWQFYLVAPLILFLLRNHSGKIIIALISLAGFVAYKKGWLGSFGLPSFLPGAVLYFATGITTRLIIHKIPPVAAFPTAAAIIAIGFYKLSRELAPFIVWGIFVCWILLDQPADKISVGIKKTMDLMFNSAPAQYLGARSYSTYLVHVPILQIICYTCITKFGLTVWPTFAMVAIFTPFLTLMLSDLFYRYVETPTIAYGKRLFSGKRLAAIRLAPAINPVPHGATQRQVISKGIGILRQIEDDGEKPMENNKNARFS